MQRRLVTRNERSFYRRKCGLCDKDMISCYHESAPFPVYCVPCWYSDKWDPMDFGQDYVFSKIFFEQFKNLSDKVPKSAVFSRNAINSEYCNICVDTKDAYSSSSLIVGENIYYSYRLDKSRDIFDCSYGVKIERCYDSLDIADSAGIFFSRYVRNSYASLFLYDVRNSNNCFGCVNMRNGQYRIFNKQYSKEEYQAKIKELDLGSYKNYREIKNKFENFKANFPRRPAMLDKVVDVTGDNVYNSKKTKFCFDSYDVEDSQYILVGVDGVKDSQDMSYAGLGCELSYEGRSIIGLGNKFSVVVHGAGNIEYSEYCINKNASDLFGCVSITSPKNFCIFNKQYREEEYKSLRERIVDHMSTTPYIDKKGRVYKYGEFFPSEAMVFAYNETNAQDYFPLTKDQALAQGFSWRDPETRSYNITLSAEQIPDHIKDIGDDILNQIISCAHKSECSDQCTQAFKIIPQELEFYRKNNLALPRLCPNCRHYARLRQRNPLKLWKRKCQCAGTASDNGVYTNTTVHPPHSTNQHCPNEFQTSYAPERPEIVYCEACYQAEII